MQTMLGAGPLTDKVDQNGTDLGHFGDNFSILFFLLLQPLLSK